MCEYCLNDESFEVTQEDVDYWRENGKYFGYPQCCIDSFCNQYALTSEQEDAIDNHGFIPCHKHAIMILENKTTLKELIKDRQCKHDYPKDDYDAALEDYKFNLEQIN